MITMCLLMVIVGFAVQDELLVLHKQLEEKEAELKNLHAWAQQEVATPKSGLNVGRGV